MFRNFVIHNGLSCRRIISFIVTSSPITKQINNNVFFKFITILASYFCSINYHFRIISINVDYWCLNHFCNIRRIVSRSRIIFITRSKAYLIVNNNMNCSTNAKTSSLRHLKRFHNNTLSREGRVSMKQYWDNF